MGIFALPAVFSASRFRLRYSIDLAHRLDFVILSLRPSASIIPLVKVIVDIPLIQILAFFVGVGILALELPAPGVKNLAIWRTWTPRIVFLLIQAVLTALYYQVIDLSGPLALC